MARDQHQDKTAANPRKLPVYGPHRPPQPPQIRSPLLGDGLELLRDSHC